MEEQKKVLITGGAGFIGSHVVDLLIENKYEVFVVDNLSSGTNLNINKKAKFFDSDITSAQLENIFKENKPDYVFHFAAQASVSFSTKFPTEDAQANILGSINVLKFCQKYDVKKVVMISTAAVYGIPERLPVDEAHPVKCLSFYGLSKHTMERYTELFSVDYIILRLANIYGPRQSAHGEAGVVAIFADKMKNNQEITIHGDGEQTRDFVFVSDVAKICLCAIQSDVKNEVINVSTNKAISINKLFEIMGDKCSYKMAPIHTEERLGDIKHSILDNTKCKNLFGYVPQTPVEDGLKKLVTF